MRRNAVVAAVAVAGAAAGAAFARLRRRPERGPEAGADPRAEELRRKLEEARDAPAEEDEFQAAGMGAETIVEEPRATPPTDAAPDDEPPSSREFEAMRRRVHEEAREAAEEMRKGPDSAES
jgi:hypothetical protein